MFEIILPFPDARLHAHAKGHWRAKAEATASLRELAHGLSHMLITQQPDRSMPWQKAAIEYVFFVPDLRTRDEANMIQSQKPAVDGIVDAGVIAGDDWQRLRIASVVTMLDRDDPRTVLRLFPWQESDA